METTVATAKDPAAHLVDARQSLGAAKLADLFPEDAAFRRSIQTYTVLLAMSGFLAAFGLYQDSTATIIGAMLVAPLGGAIMAFSGALVTGRTRWQTITFLQIVLGALMVIAIGYGVSWVLPDPLNLTPAMEARTTPGLLDLGVALAAGGAGAYVADKRTGTDALPGVAIAVALVPPLATVGICAELGRWDDAAGAMLLFLTNFSAIVVIASILFVIFGNAPTMAQLRERHRLRVGFIVTIVATLLIAIPLAIHSYRSARSIILGAQGAPIVAAWIDDRDLEVTSWSIDGEKVTIALAGAALPPSGQELATELARAFGEPVALEIRYVPVSRSNVLASP
jgi:uncharacterized hydrophobic protein (TIGR00271 family)